MKKKNDEINCVENVSTKILFFFFGLGPEHATHVHIFMRYFCQLIALGISSQNDTKMMVALQSLDLNKIYEILNKFLCDLKWKFLE